MKTFFLNLGGRPGVTTPPSLSAQCSNQFCCSAFELLLLLVGSLQFCIKGRTSRVKISLGLTSDGDEDDLDGLIVSSLKASLLTDD